MRYTMPEIIMPKRPEGPVRDFAHEIGELWKIPKDELGLTYIDDRDWPMTRPVPNTDGRPHVEVRGTSMLDKVILYHEGAHVYLYCLRYPLLELKQRPGSAGLNQFDPVEDFLNEAYATRLELEKKYSTKTKRDNALQNLYRDTAEATLDLLNFWHNIPWLAICEVISEEWGLPLQNEIREFMSTASGSVKATYENAIPILKRAPALPRARKFTDSERVLIRQLLEEWCRAIYHDEWTVEEQPS